MKKTFCQKLDDLFEAEKIRDELEKKAKEARQNYFKLLDILIRE